MMNHIITAGKLNISNQTVQRMYTLLIISLGEHVSLSNTFNTHNTMSLLYIVYSLYT